jgi:probable phosphoglycerate mutase
VLDSGRDVLMVAHSHLLRALTAVWLTLPATSGGLFSLGTGTVSELGYEHARPAVLRWNCPPAQLPEL